MSVWGQVLEALGGALLMVLPAECFNSEDICSLSVPFMQGVAGILDDRLGIPEDLSWQE